MELTLGPHDRDVVSRAVGVLAAPFDFETPEAWLEAAAERVREAVGATTSTISSPEGSGIAMVSTHYPPDVLAWYRSFYPLLRRVGYFRRSARSGVVTRREAYGAHYEEMLQTPYVREFLPYVRAHDAMSIGVPWRGRGAGPDEVLQVVLNTDDPERPFGEVQVAVAHLLYPALQAGVSAYRHLGDAYADLGALIDASGAACAVYGLDGRLLHGTPALDAVLEAEPDWEALTDAIRALARSHAADGHPVAQATVEGTRGTYALTPSRTRSVAPRPAVLVAVEAPAERALPPAQEIADRTELTPRQAEVALLLAERRSNREIAEALCISPYTARNHTEAVLSRLGLGDRRQVRDAIADV